MGCGSANMTAVQTWTLHAIPSKRFFFWYWTLFLLLSQGWKFGNICVPCISGYFVQFVGTILLFTLTPIPGPNHMGIEVGNHEIYCRSVHFISFLAKKYRMGFHAIPGKGLCKAPKQGPLQSP